MSKSIVYGKGSTSTPLCSYAAEQVGRRLSVRFTVVSRAPRQVRCPTLLRFETWPLYFTGLDNTWQTG